MSALTPAALTARVLLAELIDQYDNNETGLVQATEKAIDESRPAYWRTTSYSNSAMIMMVYWSNGVSLQAALDHVSDPRGVGKDAQSLLACLIPLNAPAVAEIKAAREEAYWAAAPGAERAA